MTQYFIYRWGKLTINQPGMIGAALSTLQKHVYITITRKLYDAFGYSVKEIRKSHKDKENNMVFISGDKEECDKYLLKLSSAGFGGINESIKKIQCNNLFRLLPKEIRRKLKEVPAKGQAIEGMVNKLLAIGIYFSYGIHNKKQFDKISEGFDSTNVS